MTFIPFALAAAAAFAGSPPISICQSNLRASAWTTFRY
jgi:hypothetical protein